jgi:hypothetical protein
METLNHIIIYNLVFSLVSSCYICNLYCMTNSVTDGGIASQLELHLQ